MSESARGPVAVTVSATALDLIAARLGETAAQRKSALRRLKFVGDDDAVDVMQRVFGLTAA